MALRGVTAESLQDSINRGLNQAAESKANIRQGAQDAKDAADSASQAAPTANAGGLSGISPRGTQALPPPSTWVDTLKSDADVALHALSAPAAAGIGYILAAEGVSAQLTAIIVAGLPALIGSLEAALESANTSEDAQMSLVEAQARALEDAKFGPADGKP